MIEVGMLNLTTRSICICSLTLGTTLFFQLDSLIRTSGISNHPFNTRVVFGSRKFSLSSVLDLSLRNSLSSHTEGKNHIIFGFSQSIARCPIPGNQ
jgi:hypothetical protein